MDAEVEDRFTRWLTRRGAAEHARDEFRRSLRAAFLSGALLTRRPPARLRAHVLALSLAAAAILVVTVVLPGTERWKADLSGPVLLSGVEFGPDQAERLAAELADSGTVEATARARFSWAGMVDVELLPGAALDFPPIAELDGLSTLEFFLARGETYLRTGPGYPGNPIVVRTPMADVDVTGTTLGVLVCAEGTCVCVAQGKVGVRGGNLPRTEVAERQTLFVHADAQPSVVKPFAGDPGSPEHEHTQDLLAFLATP